MHDIYADEGCYQALTVQVCVSAIYFQSVLGRSVAHVWVCKLRKGLGEGRIQPTRTVSFQPCVLKPYWSVIPCDEIKQCEITHNNIWIRLLHHRCWITVFTSWSKPQEPQMEEMFPRFYYITVARFLSEPGLNQMSLFSPSWLPVPHYCRDNHHVHDTQETQPPDKLLHIWAKCLRGTDISSFCPLWFQ